MKKKWHGIAFLAAGALVAVGCASTTLVPAPSPGNADARPPQTGTYIPRRIQEPAPEPESKKLAPAASLGDANANARPPQTGTYIPRRIQEPAPEPKSKKPSAAKAARAKAKAARAAKPASKEEVVTRGGFR